MFKYLLPVVLCLLLFAPACASNNGNEAILHNPNNESAEQIKGQMRTLSFGVQVFVPEGWEIPSEDNKQQWIKDQGDDYDPNAAIMYYKENGEKIAQVDISLLNLPKLYSAAALSYYIIYKEDYTEYMMQTFEENLSEIFKVNWIEVTPRVINGAFAMYTSYTLEKLDPNFTTVFPGIFMYGNGTLYNGFFSTASCSGKTTLQYREHFEPIFNVITNSIVLPEVPFTIEDLQN